MNALQPITVEPVSQEEKALWDAIMAAHHPLALNVPLEHINATGSMGI